MAIYTLRSGATAHPEDSVMQPFTDLVRVGGVLDLSDDDHLKVVERGAGINMSVDISAGRGVIKGSGNAYPIRNTTAINAAIGNNTSGNPRKDAIVLYIDLAESPTTTADDVVKTAVVAGTPAASPTAPDDAAIQTAVGGSNPFLRLADVAVAHNETEIEDIHVTDRRVQFKTRNQLAAASLTYASGLVVDVGEYNDRSTVLTGNPTVSFLNAQVDVPFIFRPIQDGTGGRTITWPSNIDWYNGAEAPPLTSTANHKDSFMFILRSNGRYEGYIIGLDANIS